MFVKVKYFAYLRETFGAKETDVLLPEGATAGRLLDILAENPSRREALFDGANLRPYLVVLVNGASLASRDGLEAQLRDGDVVAVFPMMGGG